MQIREVVGEIGLDLAHPVPREQESLQPWRERKVGEGGNVVVGEVDGILRACDSEIFYAGDFVA